MWGGLQNCAHEWGEWRERHEGREQTTSGKTRTTEHFYGEESRRFNSNHERHTAGAFCGLCGAWRGDFGLEPTPELYLEHAVLVFREVRRVLKPFGTLWLNIGDSYTGSMPCGNPGDVRLRDDKRGYRSDRLANGRGDQPSVLRRKTMRYGKDSVLRRKTMRYGKDCDPKRGASAEGQPYRHSRPTRFDEDANEEGRIHTSGKPAPVGLKPKDMVCIPWRLGLALQADGWYLRQDIIWSKSNPMPESVRDRCTKSHEYLLLFAKSERYYFNFEAIQEPASADTNARYARGRSDDHKWAVGGPLNQTIATNKPGSKFAKPVAGWAVGPGDHSTIGHAQEQADRPLKLQPGVNPKAHANGAGGKQNPSFIAAVANLVDKRNKRSVWEIATEPYPEAHYATFPQELVKPCILAGCPDGGTVLDPFAGSGTTLLVAEALNCNAIGIELGAQSIELAHRRVAQSGIAFAEEPAC
jgi:DNA modification methylase